MALELQSGCMMVGSTSRLRCGGVGEVIRPYSPWGIWNVRPVLIVFRDCGGMDVVLMA